MAKPQAKQQAGKKVLAKKNQSADFISDDSISSGSSRYMKFEKGDNKFRVLSKPITGWLEWVDKKPVRTAIDNEPEVSDDENPPKKFLAIVVLDYADNEVKILELTQQSVIKAIKALAANPDWGNPFTYDLNVEKTGDDLKTRYAVQPSPKKALSKDLMKVVNETKCNLEALFEGEDPWSVEDADSVTEYFFK